jgi:hypothetical protein
MVDTSQSKDASEVTKRLCQQIPTTDILNMVSSSSFFASARYMVVKIAHSCFEVVL